MKRASGSPCRTARCALAVVVAGSTLALPVSAAPGAPRRVDALKLGRVNIFSTAVTAGIPVRIPRDAAISTRVWSPDAWISRDVGIKGDGRLAGLVLVGEHGDSSDETTRVVALTGSWCKAPGCASSERRYYFQQSWGTERDDVYDTERLPEGRYLLFVVADRAPVEVTLRLRGLAGRTFTELAEPARAEIEMPSQGTAVDAPAGFSAYWSGRSVDLSGRGGFFLNLLWLKGDLWLRGRSGGCVYRGDPPPPPLAYAPKCPGGNDVGVEDGLVRTEFETLQRHVAFVEPGGRWSFGHYYYALANTADREELTFYLDIDDTRSQSRASPESEV